MNQEIETWLAGLPAQGRPAGGQPQCQEVADRVGREDVTGASRPLGLITRLLRAAWRRMRPYRPQHKAPRGDRREPYEAPWPPAPAPARLLPTMSLRRVYTPPMPQRPYLLRVPPYLPARLLPPEVTEQLKGHANWDEAIESMYTRAQADQVIAMLQDMAS